MTTLTLVLIVVLRSGEIGVYPMPNQIVCEDWIGKAAMYPYVKRVACLQVNKKYFQGPGITWKPGLGIEA